MNHECILDCDCHTEESKKDIKERYGTDELMPAIDCCEHCCPQWKEHTAYKKFMKGKNYLKKNS